MGDLRGERKTRLTTLAVLSMVVSHNVFGVAASSSSTSTLQYFSRSHFAFSLDLYSALVATQQNLSQTQSNLLFSPFGVSTVLGMIFLGSGAGSSTSQQLRSALKLNRLGWTYLTLSHLTDLAVSITMFRTDQWLTNCKCSWIHIKWKTVATPILFDCVFVQFQRDTFVP